MFGFGKRKADALPVVDVPTSIPKAGRRTSAGSMMRNTVRSFGGETTDRLTGSWGTTPMPADDVVRRNQRALVARSREQASNNDYMRAFLRQCRSNIVGPQGIRLQAECRDPNGKLDTVANDALEWAFWEWSKAENCDVTGRKSFRAITAGLITSAAKDGEYMLRMIYGRDAGPWGFALQVLDPQRCPVDHDVDRQPDGTFVRHGIQFNRYGRPIAYFFTTTDEREAEYFYGARAFIRVPAEQIIHGFVEDMTGQKRGLPWAATALWRMKMLAGFEEAALVNARTSASKGGFFQWKDGFGPEHDEDEELFMEAKPGAFQELPEGVEFKPWEPQYPSGEFSPFQKSMLRGIASGLGTSYATLANDLENVNFSSIRQGTLDEREHWKELQEWLIETLCWRIYREWLLVSLLAGRIVTSGGGTLKPERMQKYMAVAWQPRRWTWIDPGKDVAAAIEMKNNLMGSFGQFIRDQGRDPDQVWKEVAQDIEQMRAAGIPDEYIKQAMGQKMNPTPQPDRAPPPEA